MKKILSTVALCAICVSPLTVMAEGTTLYGQLRYSFNSVDADTDTGIDAFRGDDNVSLLGVKGSYGEDVKAFFHLQTGAKADRDMEGDAFNQRFFFGGLKGSFGKVAYGRMTNAYKFEGFKIDPFYNYSGVNAGGSYAAGGATYGLSGATNGFTDNALQYVTPSLGGVKVSAGAYVDDSNGDDHGYSAGVSYTWNDLNVGVVYATNEGTVTVPGISANGEGVRGYASYKLNDFKAALSVENVDYTDADDALYSYLTASMAVPSANMEFSASVGIVDDGPNEGLGGNIGGWYNIAKNTKLFALASYADIDPDNALFPDSDRQPMVFSIGAQHKFSISTK